MNGKKVSLLLALFVISAFLAQLVAAQDSLFDDPALAPIKKAIESKVDLPITTIGGYTPKSYPIGIVLLVWIALFALLYLVLHQIFKENPQSKTAVSWMAFAIAGIAVIGSPYVSYVTTLISFVGVMFFIGLMILGGFLVWAVFNAGKSSIGNLQSEAAKGASETNKKRLEAESEERKVKRDAQTEQKLYQREDAAINQAEALITSGVRGITGAEAQIQQLIRIVEQISQIRPDRDVVRLKQQFYSQAGAVAASIARNVKLDQQLVNLNGQLQQLEQGEIKIIERLRDEEQHAATVATRKATIQAWLHANSALLARFEADQKRLAGAMSSLVTSVQNLPTEIKAAMDAVIRDVEENNYSDAVMNLNHALNKFRQEETVLKQINSLLTEAKRTLAAVQPAINAAP